jgi:hypothetical protein
MFAYYGLGPEEIILLFGFGIMMIVVPLIAVGVTLALMRRSRIVPATGRDEIVSLATASDPQEAQLWREALEREGIRCRVVGEYLFGVVYAGHPVPEVWVRREDAGRAGRILEQLRGPASGPGGSRDSAGTKS